MTQSIYPQSKRKVFRQVALSDRWKGYYGISKEAHRGGAAPGGH